MTYLSKKLFARAKNIIPGGVNSPVRSFKNVDGEPFFVAKAAGSRITDVDNKSYIDYVGTWGPAILGHAPLAITQIIHEVAKKGVSFGTPNPWEIQLAEKIVAWVPSVEKVRMVNSGTEATMSAIRLARGFTRRDLIVKFSGCYHGHVDHLLVGAGSGAMTHDQPNSLGVPQAFASQTITLPFNDLSAVRQLFQQKGDQIAAIILEPYPANCGFIVPEKTYLAELKKITAQYGSLLIFDEVMTGFRLAKGGVQELTEVIPDLTTMGKIIGGGLPVGAFGGRADIMDFLAPLGGVYQAGTLSGNPLAMAAGWKQLTELEQHNAWQILAEKGQLLADELRRILTAKGEPHIINQVGSMFSIIFTEQTSISNMDQVVAANHNSKFFKQLFWGLLQEGIYMAPSAYETGFISLSHTTEDIKETITVFEQVVGNI